MATSSKGYFAISKETTPGTAITVPTQYYPVEEVDFDSPADRPDIREIRGSRQAYKTFEGGVKTTGSLKGAVYPSGAVGLLLYGLMGSKAAAAESTSVTAFRHTFSDGATLPSFTLERADARSGEGGILAERIAGCKVESLGLNAAFNEKLTMDVSFQAMKKRATATAVAAGGITYPSMKPLVFSGASVEIDDVADTNFKSVNMEWRNTLMREEVLNGTTQAVAITEGGQECSLSANMRFADTTMLDRFMNQTAFKIEFIFTSATVADATPTPDVYYLLHVTFDEVYATNFKNPFQAGEIIEGDVDFAVNFNDANTRSSKIEIVNIDNTTVYNS